MVNQDLKEVVNQFETWANTKIGIYQELIKTRAGVSSTLEYEAMAFSLTDAIVHIKMFAGVK